VIESSPVDRDQPAPARLIAEIAVPPNAFEDRAQSDRIKDEGRTLIAAGGRVH
jgi:hypothetical protein